MPFLTTSTTKLHYTSFPSTSSSTTIRTPVLLIHGLGSSGNYYNPLISNLASLSHPCHTLDLPGHGLSLVSPTQPTLTSLAQSILTLLDQLDLRTVILVGHSMAGLIIPVLHHMVPDRVRAAIMLGPVRPSMASVPGFEDRIKKIEGGGMDSVVDGVSGTALGEEARKGVAGSFVKEVVGRSDPEGYVGMCRLIVNTARVNDGEESGDEGNKVDYKAMKCPCLIVAGELDKSAPVAMCEKILGDVGTKEEEKKLVVLRGAAHWMAIEQPEEVTREVGSWLGELEGKS